MIGNIIGSYKITDKIGEGGMGAVFKGIDTMLEREVAIKMLKPELSSQPDIVERFRSEAVTLARLNHPNIATLYSFLRQGEDYFMVMEFVRGRTLDEIIRKFGAIDCSRAIALFCQALEGIDHAHRMGIVHRDIKPANIMLTDGGSIKVMDFGIARVLGTARMTRQGNVVGTVEYMAPEQVRGQAADARSDIYSLGILLYEMLTGQVPFESDSEFELMRAQVEDAPKPPRTLFPQIPLPVEQAIMRALAKKPEARPQSAGDLRTALLRTLNSTAPVVSGPAPYAAPTTRVLEAPLTGSQLQASSRSTAPSPANQNETQLLGGPAPPDDPTSRESKETTLPQSVAPTPVQAARASKATGSTVSMFSRLDWRHYATAAVLIVALIAAAAFALRSSRAVEPAAAEPAAQEGGTTPAAEPPGVQPPSSTAAPNADAAKTNSSVTDSNANIDKSARSRANRNEQQTTETQSVVPAPPAASNPPTTQQPPPATAQPGDAPKKDSESAGAQNLNKNQKKADEKKGGIGGFFKKVFGGGDKKNDNKNQKK
jgi:serine/threonine-protein kinase